MHPLIRGVLRIIKRQGLFNRQQTANFGSSRQFAPYHGDYIGAMSVHLISKVQQTVTEK